MKHRRLLEGIQGPCSLDKPKTGMLPQKWSSLSVKLAATLIMLHHTTSNIFELYFEMLWMHAGVRYRQPAVDLTTVILGVHAAVKMQGCPQY